jgi:Peptidase family M23
LPRSFFAALFCIALGLHAEEAPRYSVPIDCVPGETCWVVNYVDQDASAAARDYTCGPQTYDAHSGTDIAVRNLREMRRGVPVLSSAPGVVRATRDGVADRKFEPGAPASAAEIVGRECGNGVVIDHGAGWETQYCHMRQGSIAVKKGERVERGATLGLVGLSGRTEFPHVHLTLRHQGRNMDPFTGRAAPSDCTQAGESLWTAEAAAVLPYRAVSIYEAGVAGAAPSVAQVHEGEDIAPARRDSPALVVWTAVYGLRAGDELRLSLSDPAGRLLFERRRSVERATARRVELAGLRRTGESWPAGRYLGLVRVTRPQPGGKTLTVERRIAVEIE